MERPTRKRPAVSTSKRSAKTVAKKAAAKAATKPKARAGKKGEPVAVSAPVPNKRVIFIDVENTSNENALERVLEHLQVDRSKHMTTLSAIGNWRSIGAGLARLLARHGAELVHSAPAVGVRDWSDLWIAVAAGRWLAHAKPGDMLDIVSDDRAFDAVGQAAAAAGVIFNRTSYRALGVVTETAAPAEPTRRPRRRGGRRRRGRHRETATTSTAAPVENATPEETTTPPDAVKAMPSTPRIPSAEPAHEASSHEAQAASHEHVREALGRLTAGDHNRWVNLDILANALRDEGFTRPPGSPRLVTRLRHMKGVEVSPSGMVRLHSDGTAGEAVEEAPAETPRPSRRSHRGSRRSGPRKPEGGGTE